MKTDNKIHICTCQVCGTEESTECERMALHGYNRPEWLAVIGLCPGSGQPPIEHGQDIALLAMAAIEKRLVSIKDELVERGAVLTLDRRNILNPDFDLWIERFTLTKETWPQVEPREQTKIREQYRQLRATLDMARREVRALEAHHHFIAHQLIPIFGIATRERAVALTLTK